MLVKSFKFWCKVWDQLVYNVFSWSQPKRRLGQGQERETQERNWISSYSSTKQRHQDQCPFRADLWTASTAVYLSWSLLWNVTYEIVINSPAVSGMSGMVCKMGGKWLYSCCFERCCFQDLLNIARNILDKFSSHFFSNRFVRALEVRPYSSINTATVSE